jgi:hypothetical protein
MIRLHQNRLVRAVLPALSILVVAGAGCQSTGKSDSSSFASVIIHGNTPGQIKPVALEVFQADGYQLDRADLYKLEFAKLGSHWDNFAYGNWIDSSTWVRVKLEIVPVPTTSCRVQCRAFVVRDKGSSTEEEIALSHMKRKPFQKLLDKIAAQLGNP